MTTTKKIGRYGKSRAAINRTNSDHFSRPCYCRSSGTCITCAWWARLGRRLEAWRKLRDADGGAR